MNIWFVVRQRRNEQDFPACYPSEESARANVGKWIDEAATTVTLLCVPMDEKALA